MRPLVAVGLAIAYVASMPGMAYAAGDNPSIRNDTAPARDYCDDLFTKNKVDADGLLECHQKVGDMEDEIKGYVVRAARLGAGIQKDMELLTKLSFSSLMPKFRFPPAPPQAGEDRTKYNEEKVAYEKLVAEDDAKKKDLVAKCTEERNGTLTSIEGKIKHYSEYLFPKTERTMPKIGNWESYRTIKEGILTLLKMHRKFAEQINCEQK